MRRLSRTPEAVWAQVDQRGPDECWPWIGKRKREMDGSFTYGMVAHGYAHRIILGWTLGRELGRGECALHHCDNPPCCNPAHLFLGSNGDNIRDSFAKGRRHRIRTWPCPDCGSTVERVAHQSGGRCAQCAVVASREKQARKNAARRLRAA